MYPEVISDKVETCFVVLVEVIGPTHKLATLFLFEVGIESQINVLRYLLPSNRLTKSSVKLGRHRTSGPYNIMNPVFKTIPIDIHQVSVLDIKIFFLCVWTVQNVLDRFSIALLLFALTSSNLSNITKNSIPSTIFLQVQSKSSLH